MYLLGPSSFWNCVNLWFKIGSLWYACHRAQTRHSLGTHLVLTWHSLGTHLALTLHSLCTHLALTGILSPPKSSESSQKRLQVKPQAPPPKNQQKNYIWGCLHTLIFKLSPTQELNIAFAGGLLRWSKNESKTSHFGDFQDPWASVLAWRCQRISRYC